MSALAAGWKGIVTDNQCRLIGNEMSFTFINSNIVSAQTLGYSPMHLAGMVHEIITPHSVRASLLTDWYPRARMSVDGTFHPS